MWNVYRPVDGNRDVLISILYNEKPVRIPVVTDNFPYYKWKDVKAFYLSKLQAYHVGRQDDMYSYLKQLK
ncbi:MAG: hypothetical protein JST70_15790 [Bacteroidetes bacterium]|nr:hypothetical protein [Bacteroidota bacterium]